MQVQLPSAEAADALCDYLTRCGCVVQRIDEQTVEASGPPRSLRDELEQLELRAYLRMWSATHPDVELRTVPAVDSTTVRP